MFKNKKILILFFAILLFAAGLRLYKISEIPPGVNRDEASIGYTSYSLLHTGKDEYGRTFPLSFQSFGDWKLPFYIYETVISVSLLGLNELAVRLPSALAGTATVGLVFFLVKELFEDNLLSFFAMFLMAIAPWSLHLSRVESESNTAVFFTTLAMLCFLIYIKGKKWLIIPGAFCFAFCYFTYAGNYVFTTLLIIGLIFFYQSVIPKTKYFLIAITLFIIMSGCIWIINTNANHTKLSGISIFGDPAVIHAHIEIPRNEHKNPQSPFARLFHNRLIFAGERFLQNYLNTYSADFLFINGGRNNAHNIKNFGNMYIIESLFLFLGLVYLISKKIGRERNLILWWFFIAPIAASITKDAPHTNRTFAVFPILPLIVAFGIWWSIKFLQKRGYFYPAMFAFILLFLINIGIYLDRYYIHFPYEESANWGVGYKVLSQLVTQKKYANKRIIMTKPETSPYIYMLFYQKFDPQKFQQTAIRYPPTNDGFVHVKAFDRYEFREIDWGKDSHIHNALLIDNSTEVPQFIKNDYKFTNIILANGHAMFTIVETK